MTTHADIDNTATWTPDILGEGYQRQTLELGADPDGEGRAVATLVRYAPTGTGPAVLYVHGFTDYFFQRHIAEFFAARGIQFYAIDLRKCGRSLCEGQTPHFTTDLACYDADLDAALAVVRAESRGRVLLMGHSTGGLILALWLDRLARRRGGPERAGIAGLILNSPWFDLQGPGYYRGVLTPLVNVVGRWWPRAALSALASDSYGAGLHQSANGEWDYNLEWKPLLGFPIRLGWLRAIRRGHARLHRGLDIGVPALVLRSTRSRFARQWSPELDTADTVLDVRQIQRWSGCLGDRTTIVPIPDARHDVFLSTAAPRVRAFAELTRWLDAL